MEYGDICKRLENPSYAKLYLGTYILNFWEPYEVVVSVLMVHSYSITYLRLIPQLEISLTHISQDSGKEVLDLVESAFSLQEFGIEK